MTSRPPASPPVGGAPPGESTLAELADQARRAWQLFVDPRTPVVAKLIPVLAVLYLLWPIDLIPDVPVIGQLDDLAVLLLALRLFITLAPEPDDDGGEHVAASYRVVDEQG